MSDFSLPIFGDNEFPYISLCFEKSVVCFDKFKSDFAVSEIRYNHFSPLKVLVTTNNRQLTSKKYFAQFLFEQNVSGPKDRNRAEADIPNSELLYTFKDYDYVKIHKIIFDINLKAKQQYFSLSLKIKFERYKNLIDQTQNELDLIWSSEDVEELKENIKKLVALKFSKSVVLFAEEKELFELMAETCDDDAVLPIVINDHNYFLYVKKHNGKIKKFWVNLIDLVNQYLSFSWHNNDHDFQQLFMDLSAPSCILESDKKIVFINTAFARLDFEEEEVLKLYEGKKIEIDSILYEVKKSKFVEMNVAYESITFQSLQNPTLGRKENELMGAREMAIITSSIAHELKNPIAAISGVLDLLELELEGDTHEDRNENDKENLESLSQMRDNIKRCTKLVDIFLGFSKTSSIGLKKGTIKDALTEALNLLRCRIVELNYKTKFRFIGEESSFVVHLSSMTMFFYLLFSEILTLLGHKKVLDNLNKKNEINCIFRFDKKYLEIEFLNIKNIESLIDRSNLINFVANYEGIGFSIRNNVLILKEWSLESSKGIVC